MVELKNNIKCLICLLLLLSIFNTYSQKNHKLKIWNNENKLKIVDFKSLSIIDNMSANTVVAIDFFSVKKHNTFGVETVFNREKSFFVKNIDSTKSIYLLKHEQLHFDIAELFAREIRKKFYDLYLEDVFEEDVYWLEYKYYIKKYREYSIQYDKDTNHSINKELQKIWSDKIKLELSKLQKYTHKRYLQLIEEH